MSGHAPARRPATPPPAPSLVSAALSAAIVIAGAAVLVASSPLAATVDAIVPAACAAIYAIAGVVALHRRSRNRVGFLMIATALSFSIASLGASAVPALQAVGLACQTLPLALALHLLVAFPSGRVVDRDARALVVAGYVIALGLEIPEVMFGRVASPLRVAELPALGDAFILAQTVLGLFLFAWVTMILATRRRRARPALRRAIGPLSWFGPLALVLSATAALVSDFAATGPWSTLMGLIQMAVLAGLPIVFLIGLFAGAYGRAGDVHEALAGIDAVGDDPEILRVLLSRALGDPTLRILFAGPGDGDTADRIRVALLDDPPLVMEYEADVVADPDLGAEVARAVTLGLQRHRATVQLRARLVELETATKALDDARRRIVEAADDERGRIARDLHDGAQQRILALGIEAQRIARRPDDPVVVGERARELSAGLEALLVELRGLVHGLLPIALADRGLLAAVQDVADAAPVEVSVQGAVPEGLARHVASVAYFVVAEALTNAVKHSGSGSAQVRLSADDEMLSIEVTDGGAGGADAAGSGLRGIADRVEALGGSFQVRDLAEGGTVVHAEVPCGS